MAVDHRPHWIVHRSARSTRSSRGASSPTANPTPGRMSNRFASQNAERFVETASRPRATKLHRLKPKIISTIASSGQRVRSRSSTDDRER